MQSLAERDDLPRKSLATTYILLSAFGTLGVHKFYLGRPVEGCVYALTLGLCFIGTAIDFFTLPEQVRQANAGRATGFVPKPRRLRDDPPSPLSDPDAVVARYLEQHRAADLRPQPKADVSTPAYFGRRKRLV